MKYALGAAVKIKLPGDVWARATVVEIDFLEESPSFACRLLETIDCFKTGDIVDVYQHEMKAEES